MNTDERRATAALWSLRGVGPVTLRAAREALGSLGEWLARPTHEWRDRVPWRADADVEVAQLSSLAARADWLERTCARQKVEIIFPGDAAWPTRLDGIEKSPPLLFVRGPAARGSPRRRLAIVGTRHPEAGAAGRVATVAGEMAQLGVGVVSGAALGVDSAAHRGAVSKRGETWAFLGSSIDQIDPHVIPIAKELLDAGGTVFSEFPPGFRANRSSFTLRNRLISGAADAVLIFRAGKDSGALHTARAALEQGRPVLATPGEPWNASADGCNELLSSGKAQLHRGTGDLLRALGLNGSLSSPTSPSEAAVPVEQQSLGPTARTVIDVLARGPADFDSLAHALPTLSPSQLSVALVELELLGAVLQKGGRRYEKR